LSSRTARQRWPAAFRVKVTPVPLLIRLPPSSPLTASLEAAAVCGADVADVAPTGRSVEDTSGVPIDVPAAGAGPADAPVSDTVAGPLVGAEVCGAAVWAAGLELPPVPIDGWLAEGEPVGVGATVLGVVDFTTGGAVVVVVSDWSTAIDGFEPPVPMSGTVVGVGATVVAGAAVVGGAAGAAVVGVLAVVPWLPVWVAAGGEAGAVSAEAGRAFSTRRRPARSAKDATHLRGLTTSILVLVLIGRNGPPVLDCERGGRDLRRDE
jgi:hypothetical protein